MNDDLKELQRLADSGGMEMEFLEMKHKADLWCWFRANFATHPSCTGLHACETPERLEAHIEAAMAASAGSGDA